LGLSFNFTLKSTWHNERDQFGWMSLRLVLWFSSICQHGCMLSKAWLAWGMLGCIGERIRLYWWIWVIEWL